MINEYNGKMYNDDEKILKKYGITNLTRKQSSLHLSSKCETIADVKDQCKCGDVSCNLDLCREEISDWKMYDIVSVR